jgi:hypothetical protein
MGVLGGAYAAASRRPTKVTHHGPKQFFDEDFFLNKPIGASPRGGWTVVVGFVGFVVL